jgi:single-strand DNA-binding protein
MQMIGGRDAGGNRERSDTPRREAPTRRAPPSQSNTGSAPQRRDAAPASRDYGDDFADDDIPF